jgi:surfeit locus 1 family protein
MRVLVNRGWVPALARTATCPRSPPRRHVTHGIAVVPGSRFFTLGSEADSGWQPVWQNLDLARFARLAGYPVQPVVLQLAPTPRRLRARLARPDDRKERHLSYALQWYGFAASAVLIWLALGWRRPA